MKNLNLLSLLVVAILFVLSSCANQTKKKEVQSSTKPNIIWIFSDDHSFQTIGAYGGHLKELNMTPNLDKLASEGMRFNRCYVENSICAPSRACLLTGKMSHLNGKYDNRVPFNHDQQQFQKILQQNGYQTAMVGKIHLNGKMQGFDYWEVLKGQGAYENPTLFSQNDTIKYNGYTTDIITDKSLEWLKNKRNPDKPFMLMIHNKAPHRNWIPKHEYMDMFEDINIPEPANLFDDYSTRTTAAHEQDMEIDKTMRIITDVKMEKPEQYRGSIDERFASRQKDFAENPVEGIELVKLKYQHYMKDYLRCIWSVDENIGKVLAYLKESGLGENTIVMYSSDQGFYMGEHGWFDKRFMYEESFRTPLIVRWPGKVIPGSVNDDLVQNIDFAETFLDIAGAPIPEEMQGKSIVPLLNGETPDDWRESLYYHYYEYPGAHSVRRHEGIAGERYKLVRFYGMDVPKGVEWEFFDLKTDPAEMNNLYGDAGQAERIQKMKIELEALKTQYNVPAEPPVQKRRN